MPIYEYACARCGAEKEVLHGINEQPAIECADCEGEHLQRLVSAAGFRLKGGGWYETDFKAGGKRNLAADGKSDGDGKKEAAPAKAETKSDTKGSDSKGSDTKGDARKADKGTSAAA